MKYSVIFLLLIAGCAVPSARFTYTEPNGGTLAVEMQKEIKAKNLKINIDAKTGIATITADAWESRSVDIIEAEAQREKVATELIGKITEGAVKGAMKSLAPIP